MGAKENEKATLYVKLSFASYVTFTKRKISFCLLLFFSFRHWPKSMESCEGENYEWKPISWACEEGPHRLDVINNVLLSAQLYYCKANETSIICGPVTKTVLLINSVDRGKKKKKLLALFDENNERILKYQPWVPQPHSLLVGLRNDKLTVQRCLLCCQIDII